jgi:hypothetical protein
VQSILNASFSPARLLDYAVNISAQKDLEVSEYVYDEQHIFFIYGHVVDHIMSSADLYFVGTCIL